jgi:hypothetical protein
MEVFTGNLSIRGFRIATFTERAIIRGQSQKIPLNIYHDYLKLDIHGIRLFKARTIFILYNYCFSSFFQVRTDIYIYCCSRAEVTSCFVDLCCMSPSVQSRCIFVLVDTFPHFQSAIFVDIFRSNMRQAPRPLSSQGGSWD